VAFKSTAPPAVQQTLASSFEALAQQCLHPKTGKTYITSLKCGRQNSPEGMTKGLELIFVLEFEVSLLPLPSISRRFPSFNCVATRSLGENWWSLVIWIDSADWQNLEDRDYYLDHDPAHVDFKVSRPVLWLIPLVLRQVITAPDSDWRQNRVPDEFKVNDAAVLDFEVGKW